MAMPKSDVQRVQLRQNELILRPCGDSGHSFIVSSQKGGNSFIMRTRRKYFPSRKQAEAGASLTATRRDASRKSKPPQQCEIRQITTQTSQQAVAFDRGNHLVVLSIRAIEPLGRSDCLTAARVDASDPIGKDSCGNRSS
jgi:hypothetical protein